MSIIIIILYHCSCIMYVQLEQRPCNMSESENYIIIPSLSLILGTMRLRPGVIANYTPNQYIYCTGFHLEKMLAGEVAINTPRSLYLYETMNHCALILKQ